MPRCRTSCGPADSRRWAASSASSPASGPRSGVWYVRERGRPQSRAGLSRRLRIAFERLGSTYIKLGQIVSGGEGLFPEELVAEFKLLRDQVPPEPFDDVRAVVETDLGAPLAVVFAEFAEEPHRGGVDRAGARGAPAHRRRGRGQGAAAAGRRSSSATTSPRMAWLAPKLVGRIPVAALANPPALVELFAETIVEELDFRLEAENMLDIARVLADTEQRDDGRAPTAPDARDPARARDGAARGFAFDDVESMHEAGIDTNAVLHAGLIAFLEGAMLYGVFHGDLHGGNLFVQPDGRTALLDFGITGRLDEPQAPRVPPPARHRHQRRRARPARGAARPRRVPARHRPRRADPRPRSRPAR